MSSSSEPDLLTTNEALNSTTTLLNKLKEVKDKKNLSDEEYTNLVLHTIEQDLYTSKGVSYPTPQRDMYQYSNSMEHPEKLQKANVQKELLYEYDEYAQDDDKDDDNAEFAEYNEDKEHTEYEQIPDDNNIYHYKNKLVDLAVYTKAMYHTMFQSDHLLHDMYNKSFQRNNIYYMYLKKINDKGYNFQFTDAFFITDQTPFISKKGMYPYDAIKLSMLTNEYLKLCQKIREQLVKHKMVIYNTVVQSKNVKGVEDAHFNLIIFEQNNDIINMYHYEPHGKSSHMQVEYEVNTLLTFFQIGLQNAKINGKSVKVKNNRSTISYDLGIQSYTKDAIGYCYFDTLFIIYHIYQFRHLDTRNIPLGVFIPLVTKYYTTFHTKEFTFKLIVNFAWWMLTTMINEHFSRDIKESIILKTNEYLETTLRNIFPNSFDEKDVYVSETTWLSEMHKLKKPDGDLVSLQLNSDKHGTDPYTFHTYYLYEQNKEQSKARNKNKIRGCNWCGIFGRLLVKINGECKKNSDCYSNNCYKQKCRPSSLTFTNNKVEKLFNDQLKHRQKYFDERRGLSNKDPHDLKLINNK